MHLDSQYFIGYEFAYEPYIFLMDLHLDPLKFHKNPIH
jgi:hypothetical protein